MRQCVRLVRSLVSVSNEEPDKAVDVGQLLAEVGTNTLLFLLIFGMAGTVDVRNLKRQLRNRYAILTGIAMQFVIMPLLGFIAVLALKDRGLTTSMGITLLIVTASPGGSYSNWWCSLFNADLALSVAMTALSTILSIGLLPANLMLYAHAAYGFSSDGDKGEESVLKSVDFVALFVSLAIVIGAIMAGLYASYRTESNRFRKASNALGSFAGLALIVLSAVFSTNGGGESVKPWDQHWTFYVGVASPCLVGLAVANVVAKCARLEKPEIVTLSIECCYQNVGIAASAVMSMFDDKDERASAMAVPLLYGLVEAVVLGMYCLVAWKFGWTKAPSDEKICLVMAKTYEVEDDEEAHLKGGGEVEYDEYSKANSAANTMATASSGVTLNTAASSSPTHAASESLRSPTATSASTGTAHEGGQSSPEIPSNPLSAVVESDDDISYSTAESETETSPGLTLPFRRRKSEITLSSYISDSKASIRHADYPNGLPPRDRSSRRKHYGK
jgi:predicted Na+-dependent transporter